MLMKKRQRTESLAVPSMLGQNRGQAAMEFLMTYGWAILAAIIVVGVLWYIIGSPGNLAGSQFKLSQPFSANAMSYSGTTLSLEIINGAGSSVDITGITFNSGFKCANVTATTTVADGAKTIQNATTCTFAAGERINSNVAITYTKSGSSLTQRASGSLNLQAP